VKTNGVQGGGVGHRRLLDSRGGTAHRMHCVTTTTTTTTATTTTGTRTSTGITSPCCMPGGFFRRHTEQQAVARKLVASIATTTTTTTSSSSSSSSSLPSGTATRVCPQRPVPVGKRRSRKPAVPLQRRAQLLRRPSPDLSRNQRPVHRVPTTCSGLVPGAPTADVHVVPARQRLGGTCRSPTGAGTRGTTVVPPRRVRNGGARVRGRDAAAARGAVRLAAGVHHEGQLRFRGRRARRVAVVVLSAKQQCGGRGGTRVWVRGVV